MPPKKAKKNKPRLTVITGGNPNHRSKAELAAREDSEIKLGDQNLVLPKIVKKDKLAFAKWKEVVPLLDSLEQVTSADSDVVGQYCICYSELCDLRQEQAKIKKDLAETGNSSYEIMAALNKCGVNRMIVQKEAAFGKLAQRTFLDPTARIRAIPLKKPDEQTGSPLDDFGIAK